MKFSLLLPLLALAAAANTPVAFAQVAHPAKPGPRTASQPVTPAKVPASPMAMPTDEQIDARANALTVNMQKNLGLTPQQTEKVRVINHRSVESVESFRVRYRSNPRKMLSLIDDVSSSRLEALKDVLNASQFDKYQRKREEKMGIPNVQGVQGNAAPGLGSGGE